MTNADDLWSITPFEKLTLPNERDKLNAVELSIFENCPALVRIPTAQKPVMIQGMVPKYHNPDFLLLDAIFVECKGHIRDVMYRPMLQAMPDWLTLRYHVLICNNSAKERELFAKFCMKHGISHSEGTTIPLWLLQRAVDIGPMTNAKEVRWNMFQ